MLTEELRKNQCIKAFTSIKWLLNDDVSDKY